jgi:hypothetical protein
VAIDVRLRGMVRRRRRAKDLVSDPVTRVMLISVAWILFAFLIVMTWHSAFLESLIPKWMIKAIYPIDKTDLDMLRFTHFLALAVLVSRNIPRHWAPLTSHWLRPLVLCGRHSLPNFCLGVFLSFGVHYILVQYPRRRLETNWAQRRRHGNDDGARMDSGSG